jgi:hypothetical protein
MPLFPQCVYSNPAGVPYTLTPNVAGWVAPYIPTVLPCCEMPQVRNFVEESILQGLETIITPLISTSSTNTTSILNAILADNTYNQSVDISGTYTLTSELIAIGSGACLQVVLIAPVNGVNVSIRGGGKIFVPPYSTIPVNVSNLNQITAQYVTAGDVLSYYYH